jgi:predicted small lipoprotein YifL
MALAGVARRVRVVGLAVGLVATLAACGDDGPEKVPLYATTAPAPVPQQTSAINPAWVEASGETLGTNVASGEYWATVGTVGVGAEPFVEFDLAQAFFGDACLAQFGDDPDACVNDIGVQAEPHGLLPAFRSTLQVVTVVGVDQRNFAITADELIALVSGEQPASEAPDGYQFAPFPFVVTVTGGTITAARQIWTP